MEMPSWLLSEASLHSHRLLTAAFASAGSRGYHYRLLAALREYGPASQTRLGRRTGIDESDVVAAVNELAAGGYVSRTPDPEDRRRNIVAITAGGAARFRRLDKVLVQVQDELLRPLSSAERELLIDFLRRVLQASNDSAAGST
jgi:MarR family transcriptional regulator, lower aerobic nicotinate degradation pathway regulator